MPENAFARACRAARARKTKDEALADAYIAGAQRYNADPSGDPRAPYDGRTAIGKAWYRGWRDAFFKAEQRAQEAVDG